LDQNLYVNDIFDIITSSDDSISLKALFGYLSSSFVQLLAEGYLQRDITSNTVRNLPFPNIGDTELKILEQAVNTWLDSEKSLNDFNNFRNQVDNLLSNICDFSKDMTNYLSEEVSSNWKAL
jgi:hypothetical protein